MKHLVNHIIKNGGVTYNLMGGRYITSGFICSKSGNETVIKGQVTEHDILAYMAKYSSDLQKPNAHLGAWYNKADGRTYLDTSFCFETLDEAMSFGKIHNQICVFNLDTLEEIHLQEA